MKYLSHLILVVLFTLVGLTLISAEDMSFVGAKKATGLVYWDENGNGKHDESEAGVPGIRVTALHRIATTDDDGKYVLTSDGPFVTISVSFPSGTKPTSGWFRRMDREQEVDVDFGLQREKQEFPFVFVQFTDSHGSLGWFSTVAPGECEALSIKPRFYFNTGDLGSGDPSVRNVERLVNRFERTRADFEAFGQPLFAVPGNHDTVGYGGRASIEISPEDVEHPLFGSRCWERFICPSYWSFTYAGIHFMGIEWASYIDGKWEMVSQATREWIADELDSLSDGTRTILLAHNPGRGKIVVENNLALGLFGDSHTADRYYRPGEEEPVFPQRNVLIAGISQPPEYGKGRGRRYTQDGWPTGYRIVVVEEDRIDTFYKALTEPHSILVNSPRRFQAITNTDQLTVSGQVFDPKHEVKEITVNIGDRQVQPELTQRRFWIDFKATLSLEDLTQGFHNLTVEATWPEGTYRLREPYLFLTGREVKFPAAGPARIEGEASRLEESRRLLFNGTEIGVVSPGSERFSFDVPADLLKRLNHVALASGIAWKTRLANVSLSYAGKVHVDQHRISTWGYGPDLRGTKPLYFDLAMPGPAVKWSIEEVK